MEKVKKKQEAGSTSKKTKKIALGRGLDSLLPDIEPVEKASAEYFQCDVELIRPNRYQPRMQFSEDELEGMVRSIKEQGIIQPLLVRQDHSGYELVAGERRLRAAKRAGLDQVPVIVKTITDADLLEMSIVENIQREDLNPMEEAEAYHQLMAKFHLTQEQAAARVGKSRSAVANFLRLRQLPEQIKADIMSGVLSMGHARALLGASNSAHQHAAWRAVVSKGLTVRETERLVNRLKSEKKKGKKVSDSSEQRHLLSLAEELSRQFGTKVQIKRQGQTGRIEISFYSNDDLDRVLTYLRKI
jgi:ParB family chromosome partitioning protein